MAHVLSLVGEDGLAVVKGRLLCPDHVVEKLGAETVSLSKFGDVAVCSSARRCEVDGCPMESTRVTVLELPPRARGVHLDLN